MAEAEQKVVSTIRSLLKRRKAADVDFDRNSDLYADLSLDSLEVAELSTALEEELGRDPYSEGAMPRTVGEVADFYDL